MASMTIAEVLALAQQRLEPGSGDTAAREAVVLLQAVLHRDRGYFHAFPERSVADAPLAHYWSLVARRQAGEPVAYILGVREFWSLPMLVTPDTLIPRPETELLVELTLALPLPADAAVVDLGTGCGAIACALAAERPAWHLLAVDRSAAALAVAGRNVATLGLGNVVLTCSDWFAALDRGQRFEAVVSNPPYVACHDAHLQAGDLRFEPRSALVSGDDGLDAIRVLVRSAPDYLIDDGWLLCEHGYTQGLAVRELMLAAGYARVATHRDLAGRDRVTLGQWPGEAKPVRQEERS